MHTIAGREQDDQKSGRPSAAVRGPGEVIVKPAVNFFAMVFRFLFIVGLCGAAIVTIYFLINSTGEPRAPTPNTVVLSPAAIAEPMIRLPENPSPSPIYTQSTKSNTASRKAAHSNQPTLRDMRHCLELATQDAVARCAGGG